MKDFVNDALSILGWQLQFCITEVTVWRGIFSDFEPGDKIFVLKGYAVPFILWPVTTDLEVKTMRGTRLQGFHQFSITEPAVAPAF